MQLDTIVLYDSPELKNKNGKEEEQILLVLGFSFFTD